MFLSSTGTVIDVLFNHLSATGEIWNYTIKVCSRICPQKYFRNWVQILQPAGFIKYFLAAKGWSENKKASNNTGYKNLIDTEGEIIWWELQWHAILKQLQFWFALLLSSASQNKIHLCACIQMSGWMCSLLDSFTYESAWCVKRSIQAQGLN